MDKACSTAMSTTSQPLVLLNFSATLLVEARGSQKWSVIQPRFEVVEGLNAEVVMERLKLRKKYGTYFADVYGKMNMVGTTECKENSADKPPSDGGASTATKGKGTAKSAKAGKAAKEDITDAQIVNSDSPMDEVPF